MSEFIRVNTVDDEFYKISASRKENIHECSQIFTRLWPEISGNPNIKYVVFIEDRNTKKLHVCVYFKSGSNFVGPELEDDFSNSSAVINEIIYKMNDLSQEPIDVEENFYTGIFNGKKITFNRVYAGYRFTDEECEALLRGENVVATCVAKDGSTYRRLGNLALQEYMSFKYYGFNWHKNIHLAPPSFCGVNFTEKQLKAFDAGATMYIPKMYSQRTKKYFGAPIRLNRYTGKYEFVREG